ncbi:MAG: helix-turn-helix domain-containing protein [Dysgonamonadaceae bacterium]|jgi:hypothetical protein|nr:helix-turn-helix domain-containing protein [Dysgonamonadaceae bacterium]
MYIDKENFEAWMERIMERFDLIHRALERMNKQRNMLEGERLYDNQDVCQLLNVSKRTLQRYRSSGELPYNTIYHKTYYKESDLYAFIRVHFEKQDVKKNNNN